MEKIKPEPKPLFASEDDVLAKLKRPFSLSYVACQCGCSMQRIREVFYKFKTEVVEARVALGQPIDGICFQLDLLLSRDRLIKWYEQHRNTHGTEHRQSGEEQEQVSQ